MQFVPNYDEFRLPIRLTLSHYWDYNVVINFNNKFKISIFKTLLYNILILLQFKIKNAPLIKD